ncbi:hypothetical protein [Cloacibacterium normanense]|uniref:hypothetical protein n=1 Tax=Cloacibacterium normanense TaxID=237258 RepID=UPI00391952FE
MNSTYSKLILEFWKLNHQKSFGSTAIALYFFLLKSWNDKQQQDFKLSDTKLSKNIGVTRQTIASTREKLKCWGLIDFKVKNGAACQYTIISDYYKNHKNKDFNKVAPVEFNLSQNGKPSSLLPPDDVVRQDIPSFVEFLDYAKSLEPYEPLLEALLEQKYIEWKNKNWKTSLNKPISNWKILLKNLMPYLKNSSESFNEISLPNIERPKNA